MGVNGVMGNRDVKDNNSNKLEEKTFNDLIVDLRENKWQKEAGDNITISNNNNFLKIESCLLNNKFQYIGYEIMSPFNNVNAVNFKNIQENAMFLIDFVGKFTGSINVQLFIVGYSDKEKLEVNSFELNSTRYIYAKAGTKKIRVALRVTGIGKALIEKISIKVFNQYYSAILEEQIIGDFNKKQDKYLVLTNIYPSSNNLYRNAFVHRRVLLYRESGLNIDVFSLSRNPSGFGKYEFKGSTVFTGDSSGLSTLLKYRNYKKILIHFVNEEMITSIKKTAPDIPLVIWIHGFETENWYRRWFNYDFIKKDIDTIINGLGENNKKIEFMRNLYTNTDKQITFIFVSKWFKEKIAEEDIGCKVKNFNIIPNVIDEDLFKFNKKDKEKRKKILSIRPFSSKKYANDLSVKAILELCKSDFFEELEFVIYGQGILFHETLNPIKHFGNIKIFETFLTQEQIAELHKQYGIFLCPTRLDSQGVSMCEAMSSGLVPISNNITAIPEFVQSNCGILSRAEDYKGMAGGIEYLYKNPDKFIEMSSNASKYIQKKCGKSEVITKEVELILNRN